MSSIDFGEDELLRRFQERIDAEQRIEPKD